MPTTRFDPVRKPILLVIEKSKSCSKTPANGEVSRLCLDCATRDPRTSRCPAR